MENSNIEKNVNHRLATVATLAKRLVYRNIADAKLNITPDQWTILHYLWEEDGLTIGELVRQTKKDFANIMHITNILVREEYLKKEKDKHDKRCYRVYLLPKAKNIRPSIEIIHDKTLSATLKGISQEEQELFLSLLSRLENNIFDELSKKKHDLA